MAKDIQQQVKVFKSGEKRFLDRLNVTVMEGCFRLDTGVACEIRLRNLEF